MTGKHVQEAAALVTETAGVFYYLPFLMAAGVAAGGVIGLFGGLVTGKMSKGQS